MWQGSQGIYTSLHVNNNVLVGSVAAGAGELATDNLGP
jgi:hypothetical protein